MLTVHRLIKDGDIFRVYLIKAHFKCQLQYQVQIAIDEGTSEIIAGWAGQAYLQTAEAFDEDLTEAVSSAVCYLEANNYIASDGNNHWHYCNNK